MIKNIWVPIIIFGSIYLVKKLIYILPIINSLLDKEKLLTKEKIIKDDLINRENEENIKQEKYKTNVLDYTGIINDDLYSFPIQEKVEDFVKFKLPDCKYLLKENFFDRNIIVKSEEFTREDTLNKKIKLRESFEQENLNNKKQYEEQLTSLQLFITQQEEKIHNKKKINAMCTYIEYEK